MIGCPSGCWGGISGTVVIHATQGASRCSKSTENIWCVCVSVIMCWPGRTFSSIQKLHALWVFLQDVNPNHHWRWTAAVTSIFLLDCQGWDDVWKSSRSSYRLLFPPMGNESGCRPVKKKQKKNWKEGVEGPKQQKQSGWKRAGSQSASQSCSPLRLPLVMSGFQWEDLQEETHKDSDAIW